MIRTEWIERFGLEKALILERMLDWQRYAINEQANEFEGRYWFFHSMNTWLEELCGIPERTLRRHMASLRDEGVVLRRLEAAARPRTFYALDLDKLGADPEKFASGKERPKRPAQSGQSARPRAAKVQPLSKPLEKEIELEENCGAASQALALVEHTHAKPRPKRTTETTEGSATWNAYAEAYAKRYGRPPVSNGKQYALCAQLVKRLGADAPLVAAFYVTHGSRFYVQALHPLGLLVRDAEAMHTQWGAGHQVTEALARKLDTASEGSAMAARVTAKLAAKYGGAE